MTKPASQQTLQTSPSASPPLPGNAWMQRHGIVLDASGTAVISPAAAMSIRREREMESQGKRIPGAPRYLVPDAMGLGVTRNAYGEPLTDKYLRQYGRKSPVAIKVRSACVSQVSSGCPLIIGNKRNQNGDQIGLKVVHKDHFRDNPVPKGFEKFIRRGEDLLETPFEGDSRSAPVPYLELLIQGLYGDLFDLNRPVLEPIRRGGEIIGCRPADAGIIVPAWEAVRRWINDHGVTADKRDLTSMRNPTEQLEAISYEILAQTDRTIDLARAEWVVYRDGIVDGMFTHDELIVLPLMTSTDIDYFGLPPGYLQLGMEFVALSWTIHDYHGRKFTDSAWASMILALVGDGYDDDGMQEFLNNLRTMKGYQRAGLPQVVHLPDGGDLKAIDTRPPNPDADFAKMEEREEAGFCAVVRRHPQIINGSTPSATSNRLSGPSEEMRIRISMEEGQVTDVRHIAAILTRYLRMAVHDDIRVIAVFPSADRGALIDVQNKEIQNLRTRNEARVEQGLDPVGFYAPVVDYNKASDEDKEKWLKNPWNWPTDPNFLKLMQSMMGLNKGAEDAKAPEPPKDAEGRPIEQPPTPLTPKHFPGMEQ